MEHQLGDTLNLDSAIGVDFEHSEDVVVSEADIVLGSNDGGGISMSTDMEFEHIDEQAMLMETEEQIIGHDLMDEQFTLPSDSEFIMHDDHMAEVTVMDTTNKQQSILIKPEVTMDLQFEPQTLISSTNIQPEFVSNIQTQVVTLQNHQYQMKSPMRQVAIAPKPVPVVVPKVGFTGVKPLPIAPKPLALVRPSAAGMKKVTISSVQPAAKQGTVLAQIGKQLVVLPAGSAQRMKLVQGEDGVSKLQYLSGDGLFVRTKNMASQNSKVMTKVILQGASQAKSSSGLNQPAVLTQVVPANSQQPMTTRFVTMHPKSVPVSANMVLAAGSPTKQGNQTVKIVKTKQQLMSVQSPSAKLLPTQTSGTTTKKIVITTNANQNVVYKPAPPRQTQVIKAENIVSVSSGPRTQLHQINVPGKGVQYIRLVTNAADPPVASSKSQSLVNIQPKTIVLADNKGNIVMSSKEKLNQPPPLVVTGSTLLNKVNTKPQQKLVRIAPVSTSMPAAVRSSQSLLAPIMAEKAHRAPSPEPEPEHRHRSRLDATLQSIIDEAVMQDSLASSGDEMNTSVQGTVEIEYEREQCLTPDGGSMTEHDDSAEMRPQTPGLMVIKPESTERRELAYHEDQMRPCEESALNMDAESYGQYHQDASSPPLIPDTTELQIRPRKACNCTKSQCLKLYCDCFANGEFCNGCNCANCHNNLANEELRQKAIRGCLDRNPNAFRPKIGKAKSVMGPDTVRRHNKGCNCKRSGCLKNYCECYEAKIACTAICKCVGCRNLEDCVERLRRRDPPPFSDQSRHHQPPRSPPAPHRFKQPCSFLTTEVIEAVCQCLIAAATEGSGPDAVSKLEPEAAESQADEARAIRAVLEEYARCLQDIIGAAHHNPPVMALYADEDDT